VSFIKLTIQIFNTAVEQGPFVPILNLLQIKQIPFGTHQEIKVSVRVSAHYVSTLLAYPDF
jgi:hypothetical protein